MTVWRRRNSRRAWVGNTMYSMQHSCYSNSCSTDHYKRERQLAQWLLEKGIVPGLGEQLAAGQGQGLWQWV